MRLLVSKIKQHSIASIITFWLLMFVFDEFISSPLIGLIKAPDIVLDVIFKTLELTAGILFNHWLTRQPIHWRAAIGKNSIIILAIMAAIMVGATVSKLNNLADATIVAVIAAGPEEFLFRGVIFASLLANLKIQALPHRVWAAILLSSAMFSLYHFGNIVDQGLYFTLMQMIEAFGMGCLLSALYVRKGSLLFPMVLHGFIDYTITVTQGYATVITSAGNPAGTLLAAVFHMVLYIGLAVLICKPDSDSQLRGQVVAVAGRDV